MSEVEPHDEKIAFCLKLQYIVEFKPHTCMIIKRSVPSSGRFGDQPVHLVLSLIPDDQMTSTPHTVSYSPSNSEGRLSIGTGACSFSPPPPPSSLSLPLSLSLSLSLYLSVYLSIPHTQCPTLQATARAAYL